ncbi:MAG: thioredoxin domain-containing protein [Elusimicrobiota bacterium]|nr:thioredoxin domain-containing protein [Elusimicrobiota bacterium]
MGIKDIKMKEELDRELRSGGKKFLLFYSAWDSFSLEFTPAFEKLAASDPGSFCKVSTDTLPEVADVFSVGVVPTVLFFRGGQLDNRLDGMPDKGLTAESLAEFVWRCHGIV